MPRNTLADACEDRPLLWCPTHQLALVVPLRGPPAWQPLTRSVVALALAYAQAFQCQGQIDLHTVACPRCNP
jgi:hypothetical protein